MSLIPDVDGDLSTVTVKRDIRLIRRGADGIENLRSDVHLQIYFAQKTKERDSWLKERQIDIQNSDKEYLYKSFKAENYLNSIFFVEWIDKPTLVQRINTITLDQRYWNFKGSQRLFWNCKLNQSRTQVKLSVR